MELVIILHCISKIPCSMDGNLAQVSHVFQFVGGKNFELFGQGVVGSSPLANKHVIRPDSLGLYSTAWLSFSYYLRRSVCDGGLLRMATCEMTIGNHTLRPLEIYQGLVSK